MSLPAKLNIERLVLFSDAVFAIAMTLLVIEIKVPKIEEGLTDESLLLALLHLLPVFFGFLVSFFVIAIYWVIHHRVFGNLSAINTPLIWLNFLFLLTIVTMPFSCALYSEYYHPYLLVPQFFYTLNISCTGVTMFLLLNYIRNPEHHLTANQPPRDEVMRERYRALMTPAVFIFGFIVSSLTVPWLGRFSPALIPLYLVVVKRIGKRDHQKKKKNVH